MPIWERAKTTMLKVNNLEAYYGDFQALEDVSLQLEDQGIVALLGANAAGKSTTLRVISGVLSARAGTIEFNGEDLTKVSPEGRASMGIAHVPEGRKLFGSLSVEENLMLGGYPARKDRKNAERLDQVYELLPKLKERAKQQSGSLSGGEQQMCAIGRGLMSNPKVLMIDEMSLGLAPVIVQQLFGFVKEISATGVAVLLVEQQVQHALKTADNAVVIEKGRTVYQGTAAETRKNDAIREAYLGS
jgi:branched-chain amino acid transport system ATP-binding protein